MNYEGCEELEHKKKRRKKKLKTQESFFMC